jgi:uncharacterized membrane protein
MRIQRIATWLIYLQHRPRRRYARIVRVLHLNSGEQMMGATTRTVLLVFALFLWSVSAVLGVSYLIDHMYLEAALSLFAASAFGYAGYCLTLIEGPI